MVDGLKSVLVVDDSTSILKMLKYLLEGEGYRVATAETGREAMSKIKDSSFNLLLLDVKLPDIDGTDLLVEANALQPEAAKIVVTGYPSPQDRLKCLENGAKAYLKKPFSPETLLTLVKKEQIHRPITHP